jgi:ABC-type Na+ efflux pump permease subunit
MYGSNFHLEQAVTTKRASTEALGKRQNLSKNSNKKSILMLSIMAIMLAASSVSFAGPSQPRLPGGNGNAGGR